MGKEISQDTLREPVIYCTWEALLKELDNIGVGESLTEWQLRALKKGLFAARQPRDIKPHKLIKDGQGDWVLMNDTLLRVRLENNHTTASRVDVSNATKLSHLKEWANAAEKLVAVFKSGRADTYHRFCQIALDIMGNNYSLNAITRYVDKIYTQFEIEQKCSENSSNSEVLAVMAEYCKHYNLSSKFKHELKQPLNFIHIIKLTETARAYGIEPVQWLKAQIEEEAKLGRTLNLTFSYNAIAVDRMSRLVNSLTTESPKATEDEFLKALNNHISTNRRR